MKDFNAFYTSKNKVERAQFAKRAKVNAKYLELFLLPGRKKPRTSTMENLSIATDGEFSYPEIVDFFYVQNTELKEGAA